MNLDELKKKLSVFANIMSELLERTVMENINDWKAVASNVNSTEEERDAISRWTGLAVTVEDVKHLKTKVFFSGATMSCQGCFKGDVEDIIQNELKTHGLGLSERRDIALKVIVASIACGAKTIGTHPLPPEIFKKQSGRDILSSVFEQYGKNQN